MAEAPRTSARQTATPAAAAQLSAHQQAEIDRVTANMPDGPEKDAKRAELAAAAETHLTEQMRQGGTPAEPDAETSAETSSAGG